MKIYNTLSGEKKEISKDKEQNLFVCGPTVYDYSHIGHGRTYLAFDIIVKYLRSRGFKVNYIQNITDIDDKIIKRAKENNKDPLEVSSEFEQAYFEDMETLEVNSVDEYIKASEVIPEIIKQIKDLEKNGYAYKTPAGVYFRVRKFNDYGKLSNQDIDALKSGSRIEVDEEKEDPLDFVLWKIPQVEKDIQEGDKEALSNKIVSVIKNLLSDNREKEPVIVDGEPLWDSPWGWGRPGWHIEDTAISESRFGPQYDLHGGAEDLKFPHHESEIAQQEAASGLKPFVKVWMHAGFLMIDGEKMGKSLGNFITIRDFLKNHSPRLFRWIVVNNHYRSKMNYTEKLISQSKQSLNHLKNFLLKLNFVAESNKNKEEISIQEEINNMEESFHQAMEDDFNTPEATASIFKFIKNIQDNIWHVKKKESREAFTTIRELLSSLGLNIEAQQIPENVKNKVNEREKLRGNEQFIKADQLRNKIIELGYEIEDTPLGPFIKINNTNNGTE